MALLVLATTISPVTRGALWKTEEELTAEYGESVEVRRDIDSRTFTYHRNDLKLEVQFLEGVSQSISYTHVDPTTPFSAEEIEVLLKVNSDGKMWQRKDQDTWELGVPPLKASVHEWGTSHFSKDGKRSEETHYRLDVKTIAFEAKYIASLINPSRERTRTGAEKRFQGVLEFKDEEKGYRLAIIRDGQSVLEIPWAWPGNIGKAKLEAGKTYEITLRDEDRVDMDLSVAFVSDRVHKSHEARVYDSDTFPLVRIKHAGEVLFDESVCEVHKTPMQRTMADVGYGMVAAEACDKQFPHHSDWIRGGCIQGEEKTAPLYVCAECVAACAKHKREHPEEAAR